MKGLRILPPLAAAVLLAGALPLPAQQDPRSLLPVPEWQMDFENLDPERRKEFAQLVFEAKRLADQERVIECLNTIAKAEAIFDRNPALLSMKGSAYVELRDFEQARRHFQKALELQQAFLDRVDSVDNHVRSNVLRQVNSIHFNLAEMDFVTGKWQRCHEQFGRLLARGVADERIARLVEFKYLLCKLKIGQVEEARKLAGKYDYTDDHPFYYYANSALAYFDKNFEEAERWRAVARRVFSIPPGLLVAWEDTMIEFGYVKGFYGGDLSDGPGQPPAPPEPVVPE